jgi:hypothetical protein
MARSTPQTSGPAGFVPPYAPSWIDRLIDLINRLPFPNWIFYLGLYVLAVVLIHLAVWNDGLADWGHLDAYWILSGVWTVISLIFIHHLERVAGKALDRFSPVVIDKPREFAELRYRMTNMPARPVLTMSLVMGLGIFSLLIWVPDFGYAGAKSPLSIAFAVIPLVFSWSFAPVLLYYGARLLISVRAAYQLVDSIDVYHQQPLYAFSALTYQASLFWLLVINLSLVNALLIQNANTSEALVNFVVAAPMAVVALLTFLLPLTGMHRRLTDEKQRLIEEHGVHVSATQRDLYEALTRRDYATVQSLDQSILVLGRVKEEIHTIPTWPWRPGTLRNFLTAVFVPMALWAMQQVGASLIK